MLAVGDRRPYVTAIVSIGPDELRAFAAAQGLDAADPTDPLVRDAIAADVERADATLARVAQVKRFESVPEVFDATSGRVTPTMRPKRRAATERYADRIDALYG